MNLKNASPLAVLFWLMAGAGAAVLWRFMPNFTAQIGLIILLALIIISTLKNQMELPVLSTIFLGFTIVHFVQAAKPEQPLLGAVATVIGVPLLGLIGEKIGSDEAYQEGHLVLGSWLLLGLIAGEAVSIFSLWPVSFINRALLTGVVFYTFWELIHIQRQEEARPYWGHFIFVGLTVIVVIGVIIWANFPHLITY